MVGDAVVVDDCDMVFKAVVSVVNVLDASVVDVTPSIGVLANVLAVVTDIVVVVVVGASTLFSQILLKLQTNVCSKHYKPANQLKRVNLLIAIKQRHNNNETRRLHNRMKLHNVVISRLTTSSFLLRRRPALIR